ncbi:hypothetical protein DFP72DRAFT_1075529 [Ephemerocybe angulata]|uniref:Uncharacterized protein n=1 Tax=Ephemerocybe angulata TaxID=980116 RepID=A0A8H6LX55_9AGAR|nr:hypothetical protein DFP72DRAFT_1075529 [Tulosesus angulatus]
MSKPGAIEARRAQNRKAYLKRKGNPPLQLPDDIAQLASSDMVNPDYIRTFWAFCKGQDVLGLDDVYLEEDDLRALTKMPPYPHHILNSPNFHSSWPLVSAALAGFVTYRYTSTCQNWTARFHQTPMPEFQHEICEQYNYLLVEYDRLTATCGSMSESL